MKIEEMLFNAERIPFTDIDRMLSSAPNFIIYAAPLMFMFVLLEFFASRSQDRVLYERKETFGSIIVGTGNVIIGLFIKTALFVLFIAAYNVVPWRMELAWWTIIPCYIIFDFCSYWAHRISHHVRFLWGTHVTHHSADHYNLTVSFRLSWVQYLKIIFFIPVSLIGFHPVVIFVTNQLAVLYQFWQHTEYIKRLHPAIEFIFATPSSHRVHHGSQEKYINKNFGATFSFWDRMFGTFQPEEEKVIYGITHSLEHKHDPIQINFHEYFDIVSDVRKSKSFREALFYIFGDPIDVARQKQLTACSKRSEFSFNRGAITASERNRNKIRSSRKSDAKKTL